MTTDTNKQKRKRATDAEMLQRLKEKQARIEAKMAGTLVPDAETETVKRVRRAHRVRKTLLARSEFMLNGRPAGENGTGALPSIADKIKHAEKRLADLKQSQENAEQRKADLPFDIERLAKLLERAEKGEAIEFPEGLSPIPGEGEGTDSEKELDAATGASN